MEPGKFYVIRSYSHTDKRKLWSVESRPFDHELDAENWMDFVKKEHPKSKYSVVQISL